MRGCAPRPGGSPTRRARPIQLGRQLNLPPSYLLLHRVTLGSIGVLCQLEAKAPYRKIIEEWLPSFAQPKPPEAEPAEPAGPAEAEPTETEQAETEQAETGQAETAQAEPKPARKSARTRKPKA